MTHTPRLLRWPDTAGIRAVLDGGGVLLLPTDTVAGLASLPGFQARLNALKGSPPDKPIVLLVADLAQARGFWGAADPSVWRLAELWPGPLTIIAGDSPSLALRMPDHGPLRALLSACGPLACTSANLSGEDAPARAQDADPVVRARVQAEIAEDRDRRASGAASTILRFQAGAWKLVRAGDLGPERWEPRIGRVG